MSRIEELEASLVRERREIDRLIGEAKSVAVRGKSLESGIEFLEQDIDNLSKAIGVLGKFGEKRQQDLQSKIERLVTSGLQSIFGEDLSFRIVSSQRGKLAAMDFEIVSISGGVEVATPVLDARGGGIAAVAGFLLRLILLLLFKDRAQPIVVLDEAFAQVSAEYVPALASFVREFVDKTAAQIVLVTHNDGYSEVADTTFRFDVKDGRTEVREEK